MNIGLAAGLAGRGQRRDDPEMTAAPAEPRELAPGLWSWARRHPDWHPGEFGSEVAGYLARAGGETLLIDPLLDGPEDPAWELIDSELGGSLRILISIPYHVRSAEQVRDRCRDRAVVFDPRPSRRCRQARLVRDLRGVRCGGRPPRRGRGLRHRQSPTPGDATSSPVPRRSPVRRRRRRNAGRATRLEPGPADRREARLLR